MKWKVKKDPVVGDVRERTVFAFVPTKVEDHMVWLERYWICEEYIEYNDWPDHEQLWVEKSRGLLFFQY